MRAVPVESLKPGVLLGRELVDASGQVLLHRGVCLTEAYVQGLRNRGYSRVFVKDEGEPDVEIEEDLSPVIRFRAVKTLQKTLDDIASNLGALRKESEDDMVKALSSDHVRVLMSQQGLLTQIADLVAEMLDEMLSKTALAGLTSMKNEDTRLYDHSLDVCVVAIMIGKTIDLPPKRLNQLATGCLLHDIGMLFVDAAQDESRRIRQHTLLGYELLRNNNDPDLLSPHVAYEHHEHQDGTGLPRGLIGSNEIKRVRGQASAPVPALIGEVAAVANAYDNLLSGSYDQEPLAPDVVLDRITRLSGTHFNREVVDAFRRVVPVYPKGTEVMVRGEPYDRFVGLVSDVNPNVLARPFVILYRDGHGKTILPIEIDTLQYPQISLKIVGI